MSKSKHTPGPWHFDRETWTIRVKGYENNDLVGDYRGCIVASLEEAHGERPHAYAECEANARLIVAAPELLEQLKKLRDALVRYAGPEAALYEVGDANQIIAKAENSEDA